MSEKPQEDLLESIISKSIAQQEEARRAAPEDCTSLATSMICSSLSTEQGPAMTAKLPPPTQAEPTFTAVSSG